MLKKHAIRTNRHTEFAEITEIVQKEISDAGMKEGTVLVYCPHTTAGITINENADPDVKRDMIRRFDEVYPWENPLDLHGEGNTAAHLKASTAGASEQIIVTNGKLLLGTWQGIYFCEFDGPRERTFYLKLQPDHQ